MLTSRVKRQRFAMEPPYWSVRLFTDSCRPHANGHRPDNRSPGAWRITGAW